MAWPLLLKTRKHGSYRRGPSKKCRNKKNYVCAIEPVEQEYIKVLLLYSKFYF